MRSRSIALGGVTAALAVIIMCLGGIFPLSTYSIVAICCILLQVILPRLGHYCWGWYCIVSILGVLLCPDKEAVSVFAFLGYYPIIRPRIHKLPFRFLWKFLYFNVAIVTMYQVLIYVIGLGQVVSDFADVRIFMTIVTLATGNVCFFLLDYLLCMIAKGKFFQIGKKN